jgi:hypothetical protein
VFACNGPQDLERKAKLNSRDVDQLEFEVSFFFNILQQRPDSVDVLIPLANNLTELGYYSDGLVIDRKICSLLPNDSTAHYNLACSLSLMNLLDEAFVVLRRACDLGYVDFEHMRCDSDLAALHHDPRFIDISRGF